MVDGKQMLETGSDTTISIVDRNGIEEVGGFSFSASQTQKEDWHKATMSDLRGNERLIAKFFQKHRGKDILDASEKLNMELVEVHRVAQRLIRMNILAELN